MARATFSVVIIHYMNVIIHWVLHAFQLVDTSMLFFFARKLNDKMHSRK